MVWKLSIVQQKCFSESERARIPLGGGLENGKWGRDGKRGSEGKARGNVITSTLVFKEKMRLGGSQIRPPHPFHTEMGPQSSA